MSEIRVAFGNRMYPVQEVLEFPARIRRYGSMYHLVGWPDDGHRRAKAARPETAGERTSRRSASLLAFLQFLWGEASLNIWPATVESQISVSFYTNTPCTLSS
ncbi:hypothetical protein [Paraburkholderia domus]|uniref:hypothetical protein n=1 Tax=Paraburkholderia domus TaxID=2793075 RepID=UPI0019140081|nr:hypothetical protein [Paraburkholderia domus]MBK5064848.1 hypothetical protein [Burkholderia sp. R-70199]CAE6967588.1 hypothetical protein R70199_07862 [Paraburkholderia domus]